MSLHFTMDVNGVGTELDRLTHGPSTIDRIRLETILAGMFADTQRDVHVQTGSLRASGKVNSDFHDDQWDGTIAYGGGSDGPIANVRYAELEQSRGLSENEIYTTHQGMRTGQHDFMVATYFTDPLYIEALQAFMRGDA